MSVVVSVTSGVNAAERTTASRWACRSQRIRRRAKPVLTGLGAIVSGAYVDTAQTDRAVNFIGAATSLLFMAVGIYLGTTQGNWAVMLLPLLMCACSYLLFRDV
jgi:hypothetical protein